MNHREKRGESTVLEFWARLTADQTLSVPPAVASRIQGKDRVRVIVVIPDADEDRDWADLSAQQFLAGYGPDDALSDDLPAG